MLPPPPRSTLTATLFPYSPLFRSADAIGHRLDAQLSGALGQMPLGGAFDAIAPSLGEQVGGIAQRLPPSLLFLQRVGGRQREHADRKTAPLRRTPALAVTLENGRATGRERVRQYGEI